MMPLGIDPHAIIIQNTLDLVFPVTGNTLPYQQGYSLFSAISRQIPELHNPEIQYRMNSIPLVKTKQRTLWGKISEQATLRFRFQVKDLPYFLCLTGRTLDIDGHLLHVGMPRSYRLRSASTLLSRIVVIKGFLEPDAFQKAAERQLAELGIQGRVLLVPNAESKVKPRVLTIKDKRVVGFSVAITDLNGEDSLKLQAFGIGGRGKFGAGYFHAIRLRSVAL